MAMQEPTVRTIDADEAGRQWPELLEDVARSHARVIVEQDGTPVAAVISVADLQFLKRLEEQRERDFAVIDEVQEAFKDVPFEEIEREAAKALAEVRAEMREERRRAMAASE
jgi:prevent-host-death family protein